MLAKLLIDFITYSPSWYCSNNLHSKSHIEFCVVRYQCSYNYLVQKMGQSQARNFTENIQNLMDIAENLSDGENTVSVNLVRTTDNQMRPKTGLIILSGQNATGFVNVTKIENIHKEIKAKKRLTQIMHVDEIMQEMSNDQEVFQSRNPKSQKRGDEETERQLKLLTQKEVNAREVIMKKLNIQSLDEGLANRLTQKEVLGKLLKL